ncbi:Zip-domain-containing protein [Decorospora gaudefroyi]|uniref:Zip-domain-containing protein n=1 Tax=Decorospora gaudefroyi TaxID=184978 RepID=A0A6A5K335_9PLEO|nr:Zip-domain-containing protein [Decorospora gaudefroyi]
MYGLVPFPNTDMLKPNRRPVHQYELLPRGSFESEQAFDVEPATSTSNTSNPSWLHRLGNRFRGVNRFSERAVYTHYVTPRRRKRSILRLLYWSVFSVPYILAILVIFTGIFFPSYTVRPAHYQELRQRALNEGRANPYNETVFIVASLAEKKGDLTSGAWGQEILELVDLLGPQNVYLSIYEDNADLVTKQSLVSFRQKVKCNSTIVSEQLDLASLPHIALPNGDVRLQRIAFLAEVRNRALAPIDQHGLHFDRVLYLNDVHFDPIEAAQLLFATNIDSTGRADYAAACAVDHIMPFKFYDRFATRDFDGMITGVPFFPWFTSGGTGTSRKDVLAGKDAVRVRSCWGGMVAFEAKWFQERPGVPSGAAAGQSPNHTLPLRFRYDTVPFWEASECCLINADLQYRMSGKGMPAESRIYVNPFVRVAYDKKTLSWLSLVRRPERLYAPIHNILNYFVGFPKTHVRFAEEPGEMVTDKIWVFDDPAAAFASGAPEADLAGHYTNRTRKVAPGGFSSIICVDLVIRQFPGKKNFKIQDSNAFLSTGLSLSFGVMIFSSLYSMLPSAKNYLKKGGMSPRSAILTLIGCFLVGALGISVLSGILHKYIPHSIVDCNDEHGADEDGKEHDEEEAHSHPPMQEQQPGLPEADEHHNHRHHASNSEDSHPTVPARRPSLHSAISSKVSQLVTGAEKLCDDNGQCYGDLCEIRPARLQARKSLGNLSASRPSGVNRVQTTQGPHERRALLEDVDETTPLIPTRSGPPTMDGSLASLASTNGHTEPHSEGPNDSTPLRKHSRTFSTSSATTHASHTHSHHHAHNHDHDHDHDHASHQHHHHVPTNAFLSLGLQTSTAIALHKIPEGFITYATNHANPTLGLSIFVALFIHNITEGFALALPLYLAINSRWKAMLISAVLGGVSQPLGAGVAALWFKIQGRAREGAEDGEMDTVYGCMFAVTAGIMAMVSLQLLGESLDLTHSRRLCFVSAFAGMGILGLSSALTA